MRAWPNNHFAADVVRSEIQMHKYQDEAVDWLWNTPYSALWVDTGLGKTCIILTLLVRLFFANKLGRVLIVAPVRVAAETWPTEIRSWDHTCFLNFTVLRVDDDDPELQAAGKAAREAFKRSPDYAAKTAEHERLKATKAEFKFWCSTRDEFRKWRKMPIGETPNTAAQQARMKAKRAKLRRLASTKASIHIINREALEWLVTFWGAAWPYDTVIVDESSCISDHKTTRFKALVHVRRKLLRLHELTATPAANTYMGLFAQAYAIDLGQRFGKSFTKYREKYFNQNPYSKTYKIKNGAQKAISSKFGGIAKVMKSEDYLKETPPLFLERKLSMVPAELNAYKKFERTLIYTLPDGEIIEAETASALSGKLLQLASGSIYTASGETRVVHDHKIADLAELAEELAVADKPILVAYWYKSSLARLKKAFPKAVVMDKGGKAVKPWNEGKIKMLLVHPASVGHGLNMQYGPGHHLYMFDLCWSYELFYQLYRRLHRQGQTQRVVVHMTQMRETNDELVAARLDLKQDAQEVLFKRVTYLHKLALAGKLVAVNDDDDDDFDEFEEAA